MHSTNSFNYLFLKRFIHLRQILIPLSSNSSHDNHRHERFYSHPLFFILLIMLNEILVQFIVYLIRLVPSQFYDEFGKLPDKRDFPAFHWLIIRSFG